MAKLVVGLVAVACAFVAFAAPAMASQQYYVTVSNLEGQFDRAPENLELRVSPALPEGASLSGRANCEEVYIPGTNNTESVFSFPKPGSYQFVTESCTSDASEPLELHGVSGTITILGGVYNIEKNPTELAAVAAESENEAHEPVVTFGAQVINRTLDDSAIPEAEVEFGFQGVHGLPFHACDAKTTGLEKLDETGQSIGICSVEGKVAQEIEEGDGQWNARYVATADYGESLTSGEVPGKQTAAQADQELQNQLTKGNIEIVEKVIPPNCERKTEAVGLIQVSLGQLNCTELKILQVTTQVCLIVVTIAAGDSATLGVTAELFKKVFGVVAKATLDGFLEKGGQNGRPPVDEEEEEEEQTANELLEAEEDE